MKKPWAFSVCGKTLTIGQAAKVAVRALQQPVPAGNGIHFFDEETWAFRD